MATSPLPHPARRIAHRGFKQRALHALSYATAAILGLCVGPLLLMIADRATFLHWTNLVLDLVSGR